MNTDKKDLEYWKNNCDENYITTPISVLRYITELESALEQVKNNVSLGCVSIKSLKANLKILIFNARADWEKFDSEGNEFASRKAYGQFIAYKNLHDGINNGAFKD